MDNYDCTCLLKRTATIPDYYKVEAELTVEYGTRKIGGHTAYISVTGEIRVCGRLEACGQLHEYIRTVYPDLVPLIDLHLVNVEGMPMHYFVNAKHWLSVLHSKHLQELGSLDAREYKAVFGPEIWKYSTWRQGDSDPLHALRSTVCCGVLGEEDSELDSMLSAARAPLIRWSDLLAQLESRLPLLRNHVKATLKSMLD